MLSACSTRTVTPPVLSIDDSPPPLQIPDTLISPYTPAVPFAVRDDRTLLEMETEVIAPLAAERLDLIRDRAQVRCLIRAYQRDPWVVPDCGAGEVREANTDAPPVPPPR